MFPVQIVVVVAVGLVALFISFKRASKQRSAEEVFLAQIAVCISITSCWQHGINHFIAAKQLFLVELDDLATHVRGYLAELSHC